MHAVLKNDKQQSNEQHKRYPKLTRHMYTPRRSIPYLLLQTLEYSVLCTEYKYNRWSMILWSKEQRVTEELYPLPPNKQKWSSLFLEKQVQNISSNYTKYPQMSTNFQGRCSSFLVARLRCIFAFCIIHSMATGNWQTKRRRQQMQRTQGRSTKKTTRIIIHS